MCDLYVLKPLCCIGSALDYVLEKGVRNASSPSESSPNSSKRKKKKIKKRRGSGNGNTNKKGDRPDHERYYYQRQRLRQRGPSNTMTTASTNEEDGIFDDLSEPDSWIGDEIDIDMRTSMVDDEETMTTCSGTLLASDDDSDEEEESDSEFMYVKNEGDYAYSMNTEYDTRQDTVVLRKYSSSNSNMKMSNLTPNTIERGGGGEEDTSAIESRTEEEEFSLLNITRSEEEADNTTDGGEDVVVKMMERHAREELVGVAERRELRQKISLHQQQRKHELEAEMFEESVKKDTDDFFKDFFSTPPNKWKNNGVGDQSTILYDDESTLFGDDSKTYFSAKDRSVISVTDKSMHSSVTSTSMPAQ